MNARQQGLINKFNISRTDGRDSLGGDRFGADYFVLDLTYDKFADAAALAYADACKAEYPLLATDLRNKINAKAISSSEYITVPETTLPGGQVVPAFKVAKYLASQAPGGYPVSSATGTPWVDINYHDAIATVKKAGLALLTETQALAIAYNISQQPINWTGGQVGEGKIYQGLHKDTVSSAQPASYESANPEERRWHELSNGERIYDFAGNAYTWVFDNVQGDDAGLTTIINADSISLTTAPYPSCEKGMGYRPDGECKWSGNALIRGGCWYSGSDAGVFGLYGDWPGDAVGYVGFRCTQPGL